MDNMRDISDLLQDMLRNAFCTGSGWVARREAIQDIGGIPPEYTQEDKATSALLHARAWEVAFVRKPLQWGLAPNTSIDHVK